MEKVPGQYRKDSREKRESGEHGTMQYKYVQMYLFESTVFKVQYIQDSVYSILSKDISNIQYRSIQCANVVS